jgi:hypothetical protein
MNKNIPLTMEINYHSIFGGKSIVVLDFISRKHENFKIRLRFIKDDNKKIALDALVDSLKNSIRQLDTVNRMLIDKAGMLEFIRSLNLKKLENHDIALECLDISDGIVKFSINENGNSCHKYSLPFFSLTKPNESNKDIHFGYEMQVENDPDKKPYDVAYFFSRTDIQGDTRQVTRKIYLFPIDKKSLEIAQQAISHCQDISQLKLDIPYVSYDPNRIDELGYIEEIQTKLDIQTIIAETLMHLKPTKFFRKDNSEKIQIFNALAKKIAAGESLKEIRQNLNQHDKWEILSQHRDPWGIFSLFKGKTHSVMAWELLNERLGVVFSADANTSNTVLTRH